MGKSLFEKAQIRGFKQSTLMAVLLEIHAITHCMFVNNDTDIVKVLSAVYITQKNLQRNKQTEKNYFDIQKYFMMTNYYW